MAGTSPAMTFLKGSFLTSATTGSDLQPVEGELSMEVNGVAHTFITASNFEASVAFYRQLLPFLGLQGVGYAPAFFYCVGGRTGFGINRPTPENAGAKFDQWRVGMHHHCWRARERAEVH